MAKAKEIELDSDSESESKVELTEEEIEFEAVLEELGPSVVKWHITCISPPNKAGYVATWQSGEEISLDRVAREFGAGEYKIRPIGARGRMVPGGRNVKISSNAAYERERAKASATPTPAAPAAPAQAIGIGEIIALIQSQQTSNMSLVQSMMTSQTNLLTAIMARPVPEPREGLGAPELVSMMESMKNMVTPEGSGGVDTLLKGIELARSLESGGGGETDFLGIAAKGLDVIGNIVKRSDSPQPARKVQVRQVRPQPVKPQPQPQAARPDEPKSEAPSQSKEQSMLQWLKVQVAGLVRLAKREADPQLYAAVFLDNLPDGLTDETLREHFGDSSAVAKLAFVNAEVSSYSEWFEEFRVAVIAQLDAQNEPDDDLEGEAGEGEAQGSDD